MDENHYTNAVNNLERLLNFCAPRLSKETLKTLRYNIFFLKLSPQYKFPEEPSPTETENS